MAQTVRDVVIQLQLKQIGSADLKTPNLSEFKNQLADSAKQVENLNRSMALMFQRRDTGISTTAQRAASETVNASVTPPDTSLTTTALRNIQTVSIETRDSVRNSANVVVTPPDTTQVTAALNTVKKTSVSSGDILAATWNESAGRWRTASGKFVSDLDVFVAKQVDATRSANIMTRMLDEEAEAAKRSGTAVGTSGTQVGETGRHAIKFANELRQAGEAAFTLARGVAFMSASTDEDFKKMVVALAKVQGAFDIFRGSVQVVKAVSEGVEALRKAGAAAATAQAAGNAAVAATASASATAQTAQAGATVTVSGAQAGATVTAGLLAVANTAIATTAGIAATASRALYSALGPVGLILAGLTLAWGAVTAVIDHYANKTEDATEKAKLNAEALKLQEHALVNMKAALDLVTAGSEAASRASQEFGSRISIVGEMQAAEKSMRDIAVQRREILAKPARLFETDSTRVEDQVKAANELHKQSLEVLGTEEKIRGIRASEASGIESIGKKRAEQEAEINREYEAKIEIARKDAEKLRAGVAPAVGVPDDQKGRLGTALGARFSEQSGRTINPEKERNTQLAIIEREEADKILKLEKERAGELAALPAKADLEIAKLKTVAAQEELDTQQKRREVLEQNVQSHREILNTVKATAAEEINRNSSRLRQFADLDPGEQQQVQRILAQREAGLPLHPEQRKIVERFFPETFGKEKEDDISRRNIGTPFERLATQENTNQQDARQRLRDAVLGDKRVQQQKEQVDKAEQALSGTSSFMEKLLDAFEQQGKIVMELTRRLDAIVTSSGLTQNAAPPVGPIQ